MTNKFVSEVLFYSIKLWVIMFLWLIPMLICVWLIQSFQVGIVARFNLFFIFLFTSLAVMYLISRFTLLVNCKPPKLTLKRAQWETALGVLSWLQSHETATFMLLMSGIVIAFIPAFYIWVALYYAGFLNSLVSAFTLLFIVILPFFMIPALFLSCIYDSIVRPDNPTLNQVERIVSVLYSNRELTGERLEEAKHTFISKTTKKTKVVGIFGLTLLASVMLALQLIEWNIISSQFLIYLPWICLIAVIPIIILMIFEAKGKSELETWIDSRAETKMCSSECLHQKIGMNIASKLNLKAYRVVVYIEKNWVYRFFVIIGGVLSLIAAIYWVINLLH